MNEQKHKVYFCDQDGPYLYRYLDGFEFAKASTSGKFGAYGMAIRNGKKHKIVFLFDDAYDPDTLSAAMHMVVDRITPAFDCLFAKPTRAGGKND